jgi:flagellar biosynthesis/type III secretory pathway protein FliH
LRTELEGITMDFKKIIADLAAGYRKFSGPATPTSSLAPPGPGADVDAAYAAHEAGRQVGHEVGRAEGYEFGRKEGYEVGHAEGYEIGYKDGYDEGFQIGLEAKTPPQSDPPPEPPSN